MRPAMTTAALLLAACQAREDAADPPTSNKAEIALAPALPDVDQAQGWHLTSNSEGAALALLPAQGNAMIRLFCPAGKRQLLVNVPAFRAIGSEERLSFGSDGSVTALVADTKGDAQRGGVSATGAVPANLAALLGRPLSASYGAQKSGPHPVPPENISLVFVAACSGKSVGFVSSPTADMAVAAEPAAGSANPCLIQGRERLSVKPLRAVGTEPFWGARIEGRCVTYSHPDDQAGTRIWTRYAKQADGGTWSGSLGGRPFTLRTRAKPGCSDGMSDKIYPLAVELMVDGEKRTGCAAPV